MSEHEPKYWLHRISHEWKVSYPLLDQGILSTGWSDFGTIEKFDRIKEDLEKTIIDEWGGLGKNRFYLKRFALKMKKGDYVIIPKYGCFDIYKIVGKNVITAEELFNREDLSKMLGRNIKMKNNVLTLNGNPVDLGFFWDVEAVSKGISRNNKLDPRLIAKMRYLGTNINISDISDAIIPYIEKENIKNPETQSFDLEKIKRSIEHKKTEYLIEWYLKELGADFVDLKRKKRDNVKYVSADVLAMFDLFHITIFVKIKQKEDKDNIEEWYNTQVTIIERYKKAYSERFLFLLISSKNEFTDSKIEESISNIKCLNRKDIDELMMDAGYVLDEEKKHKGNLTLQILSSFIKESAFYNSNISIVRSSLYKRFSEALCKTDFCVKKEEIIKNLKVDVAILKNKKIYAVVLIGAYDKQKFNYKSRMMFRLLGSSANINFGILTDGNRFLLYSKHNATQCFPFTTFEDVVDFLRKNKTDFGKNDEIKFNKICDVLKEYNYEKYTSLVEKSEGICKFIKNNESKFWGEIVGSENVSTEIYRYIPLSTLFQMLNNGTYRMCSISGMNDKSEIDYFDKYCGIKNNIDSDKAIDFNRVFISSCSLKKDDLTMWRLYGDDAKGACLVFKLKEGYDGSIVCRKVNYPQYDAQESEALNTHRQLNVIKELISAGLMFNEIAMWKHLFKSKEYAHEDEVRLIYVSDEMTSKEEEERKNIKWVQTYNHSIILPIVEFDMLNNEEFPLELVSIILGPKCPSSKENIHQIYTLARRRGFNIDESMIIPSENINYR